MVLVAISGELGAGKTLTLTYLAWNNYYYKKRKIASNYTLYGIPFTYIRTVDDFFKFIPEQVTEEEILSGEEKAFMGDDFWKWIGTQTFGVGSKKKKEIVQRILMASRKAYVTVFYTTQLMKLISPNIREITDLLMKPVLSADKSYCKVYVYGIIEGKFLQPMPPFYFNTRPIYALYNTYEVAGNIYFGSEIDKTEKEELKEIVIPIEKNPAWKKYCRDELGLDINNQEEFKKYCHQILKSILPTHY